MDPERGGLLTKNQDAERKKQQAKKNYGETIAKHVEHRTTPSDRDQRRLFYEGQAAGMQQAIIEAELIEKFPSIVIIDKIPKPASEALSSEPVVGKVKTRPGRASSSIMAPERTPVLVS